MSAIKNKATVPILYFVLFVNLVLFAVKLYIGLSTNSISIYSDGINNLFDGFSAVGTLICFYLVNKGRDRFSSFFAVKTEQLVSLSLSVVIFAVGLAFLYNSAERLMYPAPLWFTADMLYILSATAAVKLGLFFFLRSRASAHKSDILRLMSVDSLTDFFITAVTVLTMLISQKGGYSVDSFGGIAISLFIIAAALKSIKEGVTLVLSLPDRKTRKVVEALLNEAFDSKAFEAEFSFLDEKRVYVKIYEEITAQVLEELGGKVYNETGIRLYIIN